MSQTARASIIRKKTAEDSPWRSFAKPYMRFCSPVCKPGSVDTRGCPTTIYLRVPSPRCFAALAARHPMSLAEVGPTCLAASHGVASDRVYSKSMLPWKWVSSYLAFPSLPFKGRRSISVALFRRLPAADVISYPALRCPDFPHGTTFRRDTARPSDEATLLLYHTLSKKSRRFLVRFRMDSVVLQ